MKTLSLSLFQNSELIPLLLISALTAGILYLLYRILPFREKEDPKRNGSSLPFVKSSKYRKRLTKKDRFVMITATILYAVVSLWQLGSASFPNTTWQPDPVTGNTSFILELPEDTSFDQVIAIYGEGENNRNPDTYQLGVSGMRIEGSNDKNRWLQVCILDSGSIYQYQTVSGDWNYRYIRVTAADKNASLSEIAFRRTGSDSLLPVKVDPDGSGTSEFPDSLAIDEQDKVALSPTYMDQGYFDEVYHPRNAWEIANGQYMYASVHPLLGTNIMALFIRMFGMSPFVWRLPGALFGIAMVPLFYLILKLLFEKTFLCTLGTVLLCGDFMHLTTSRIGTLEPFSVFWILMMFYWMLKYYKMSFYDTDFAKTLRTLLVCGIFMGIAIASKWTGCYSAIGLAILLFTSFAQRWVEYTKAQRFRKKKNLTPEQKKECDHILSVFPKYLWTTVAFCFLFFLFIPIVIYWLSYLPDHVWRNGWSIANVWNQNLYMYNYHSGLQATHPYQSSWYQWILDIRPIWYYWGTGADGMCHTISCFSNPLLTWLGLPAILFTLYRAIRKDTTAWAIVIGYFTALGPWMSFVQRCVFAYHFYPTSFFTMLAIVYAAKVLLKKHKGTAKLIVALEVVYVLFFIGFLPVTAGFGTTHEYIKSLEWFSTWYFG